MAPIIIKGPKTPAGMGQVIPIKNKKVFNKNKIKVFIVSLNSPNKNPTVKIIHYNIVVSLHFRSRTSPPKRSLNNNLSPILKKSM